MELLRLVMQKIFSNLSNYSPSSDQLDICMTEIMQSVTVVDHHREAPAETP